MPTPNLPPVGKRKVHNVTYKSEHLTILLDSCLNTFISGIPNKDTARIARNIDIFSPVSRRQPARIEEQIVVAEIDPPAAEPFSPLIL